MINNIDAKKASVFEAVHIIAHVLNGTQMSVPKMFANKKTSNMNFTQFVKRSKFTQFV